MKRSVYIIFLYLFASGLSFSVFSGTKILHKSYAERQLYFVENYYDNPINQDSVRYFKEVNRLQVLALDNNDRELYLETLYMRLNYLSSRNYKNYIRELTDLIKIADKEKRLYLQIRTRQALGFHYYYELNNYGKAIWYFLKSYEYLQLIHETDFPEKQEALSNIANICYNAGYEDKALKFVNEAKKYNYKYASVLILNLMNTEGLIYQKYGDEERAEEVFREILKESGKRGNVPWQFISSGNLATLYFNQKKYDKAIEALKQSPPISKADYRHENYAYEFTNQLLLYAEIYLQTDDTLSFFESVKKITENREFLLSHLKIQHRLFYLYYKYYSYQNDWKKSLSYSDSLITAQTKINEIVHANSIKIAVEKDNYDRYVKKEKALKREQQRVNRLKLIYLSASLLLLSVIMFVYFRKRRKYKAKIIIQQNKIREKEEEIMKAQLYLEQFLTDNKKKDQVINQLSEQITIENKRSLLDMLILTDDDWIKFKKEFITVYPHFFDKLKQISPKITPALERLSALLFIGLDNSQIANMLGIGKESVSRTKRRLREYLQLPLDTDFKTWFESR